MSDPNFSLKRKRASGAGRPHGSGKYAEKTKVVRLPESMAQDIEQFVARYQDLERIIYQWSEELEPRKTSERVKLAYELVSELINVLQD